MYSFTNQFSGPTLRERIGMMNGQRSGYASLWRYGVWALLLGIMVLACRHRVGEEAFVRSRLEPKLPLTNATRVLADQLDANGMPWFRQSALLKNDREQTKIINGRKVAVMSYSSYPEIICLRDGKLSLRQPENFRVKLFINGQESSEKALPALSFSEVEDLMVYQKWDDALGAEKYPESYRVLISTTHETLPLTSLRSNWEKYLKAAGISEHPLGLSSTFTMNKLLEATFFNNKLTFVQRTKSNYLTLIDSFSEDIDLYINGLVATPEDIAKVHVREVDKLYANERSFEMWTDGPKRQHRYVLYIQTTPKRAKRDSSYYVFSPFYTGDF